MALQDTRILVSFRAVQMRGRARRRARSALGAVVLVTIAFAWIPQYLPQGHPSRIRVLVLLPSALLAFVAITTLAATASGGGRELIARAEATPYPISGRTDFLVGVVLAPLNIAWLMETWLLLAATSYGIGQHWQVLPAQLITLGWILSATVVGQAVAAGIEVVRRLRGGVRAVRGLGVALVGISAWLVMSHRLTPLLDRGFITTWLVNAQMRFLADSWSHGAVALAAFGGAILVSIALGSWLVAQASRRQAVEEVRLESGMRTSRPHPGSDFVALLRIDRASVWRAVPLRRGILFLGVLPGAVALAGSLHWQVIAMFPGLVASGGALLFGVNIWCLDARGALWRESLPVSAGLVFAVRSWVLGELLLAAMVPAIALGALRAGPPTAAEVGSVVAAAVAMIVFVTGRCLRWSITSPYPADLRGARATPAPPLAMVGYSARLALTTTLLGLLFYGTSLTSVGWAVLVAVPAILFAASDLAYTARLWDSAQTRAGVLSTVAA